MPKAGDLFINAVGVEVVAHGGSTPAAPDLSQNSQPDQVINADLHSDVFGRLYDPAVPVFLPTGSRLVFDRLATVSAAKGSAFGSLIDIDSLNDLAADKKHVWGGSEHGMPPQWWLDANGPFTTPIQPGYGTGSSPVTQPPVHLGTSISGSTVIPDTLTCTSEWGSVPESGVLTVMYQWKRSGVDIPGATTDTYTTQVNLDEFEAISCETTASNDHGTSGPEQSNIITPRDATLPTTLSMVPGVLSANAGYYGTNMVGTMTPYGIEGEILDRLQSFGANWCMLDLKPVSNDNPWAGVSAVRVTFSGPFVGTGVLTNGTLGYSYGGTVANIQAGLNAAVGQAVTVVVEPV